MQIMPGAATHTVKMFSIPDYRGPGQLLGEDQHQRWHQLFCGMSISSLVITVFRLGGV